MKTTVAISIIFIALLVWTWERPSEYATEKQQFIRELKQAQLPATIEKPKTLIKSGGNDVVVLKTEADRQAVIGWFENGN